MTYKITILVALMTLSATLSGCKTLDAYTGKEKTSNTTINSAIGAGIGAFIGYATSKDKSRRDRQKAILVGAGIGGLSGAAIGSYMDKQEAALRKKLEGTGVSVTRNNDDLILNMPGNVTFATGSKTLKSNFNEVLNSVVLVLNEFNQTLIEVAGHTDSVGSESSNLSLSNSRAQSVGNYLISQKIKADRVLTIGYGESRPIADNKTAAGRQQNRRVELTLIPVKAN